MFIDHETLLSDSQAITVAAPSTNIYDTGAAADPGAGNAIGVTGYATAAFTASSISLAIAMQTSVDAAFTSPIELYTHTIPSPILLGTHFHLAPIPTGCKRYIRAYYTPSATASAGSVFLDLQATPSPQANVPPPDGLTVP